MKHHTFVLFILLLATPLALLAWLGQRSLTQDRIVIDHQAQELAESRLREAQALVHGFINELQQSSTTALAFLQIRNTVTDDDVRLIRKAVSLDPFLEQVFVLDADDKPQFPLDSQDFSNGERQFLNKLTPLLADENAFRLRLLPEGSKTPFTNRTRDRRLLSSVTKGSDRKDPVTMVSELEPNSQSTQIGWTNWTLAPPPTLIFGSALKTDFSSVRNYLQPIGYRSLLLGCHQRVPPAI